MKTKFLKLSSNTPFSPKSNNNNNNNKDEAAARMIILYEKKNTYVSQAQPSSVSQ